MTKSQITFIIPSFFNLETYQKILYYNDLPLGTLQISSYLKKHHDIKTDIIDMRVEEENDLKWDSESNDIIKFKEFCLKVLESKIQDSQYIGINCFTSFQYLQSKIIAELIKKNFKDTIIFIGGYHPSSKPQDFSYPKSPFDFVLINEAEHLLSEYLKNEENRINTNNKRTKILKTNNIIDVNDLPLPDYELYLNKYPYYNKFKFELYTSRGCPYQCAFCSLNYRFRTYNFDNFKKIFENLVDIVLKRNKKYPKITFADQAFFSLSIKDKILDYIIKEELQDKITFSCQSRVETVGNELRLIKKIKKVKLIIGYGLESADKKLLVEMKKTKSPTNYLNKMKDIIGIYKNSNINYCRLNILCGFPSENKTSFDNTIDFIRKYASHENIQLSPSLFSCYPNTLVYHNMKYYENLYGSEFNDNWWKSNENQFKFSVLKKCSFNYLLRDLIYDYKEKYLPLLNMFKFSSFRDLAIWKKFYNDWYNELNFN
ncbi:MAG: B12-binding domain-containing radical SAM protein [Promethearchaeati archaeon]